MFTASVDPGWSRALEPVEPQLAAIEHRLQAERAAGREFLPPANRVLRAFEQPFDAVRVLIVGQDPYPTPGHAVGLAFAVEPRVRPLPPSLRNIHRELEADLGIATPQHGDLSAWTHRGVLLLNRVLTVRPGAAGSHRGIGWEAVTEHAVRALVARGRPLVAVLWGQQAQTLGHALGDTPVIVSAHPSPLSARRGFLGSRPFSRANALLTAQGAEPVDWALPAQA